MKKPLILLNLIIPIFFLSIVGLGNLQRSFEFKVLFQCLNSDSNSEIKTIWLEIPHMSRCNADVNLFTNTDLKAIYHWLQFNDSSNIDFSKILHSHLVPIYAWRDGMFVDQSRGAKFEGNEPLFIGQLAVQAWKVGNYPLAEQLTVEAMKSSSNSSVPDTIVRGIGGNIPTEVSLEHLDRIYVHITSVNKPPLDFFSVWFRVMRRQKAWVEAEKACDTLQKNFGNVPESFYCQIELAFYQEDYELAEEVAQQSINQYPSEATAHFWMGYSSYYLEEYDLAAKVFETSIELNEFPTDELYLRLADSQYALGDWAESKNNYLKALKLTNNPTIIEMVNEKLEELR